MFTIAPPPAVTHPARHRLVGEHDAGEIDVEHALPRLERLSEQPLVAPLPRILADLFGDLPADVTSMGDAGRGHAGVETAEGGHRSICHCLVLLGISCVDLRPSRIPPAAGDLSGHGLGPVGIQVGHDNRCSLLGEAQRARSADARGAASDHCDLAVHSAHRASFPLFCLRPACGRPNGQRPSRRRRGR